MRIRYLLCVCLVLAAAIAGCRKESEPAVKEPAPEKAAKDSIVQEQPTAEEPVKEKPVSEEVVAEETEYFAVFMEGKKIGHAIQSRDVVDGNVVTTEKASMTISRDGVAVTMNMMETFIETTDGKPLGFKHYRI